VIWYLENYRRHRREREALEALTTGADWLTPLQWRVDAELRLIWDAEIHAGGRTFPISLRYPSHFRILRPSYYHVTIRRVVSPPIRAGW
jgi:hypothetical protein